MGTLPDTLESYARVLQGPLIGSFFSMLLYGVGCVQAFFYFQTYPDDLVRLKCLVAIIWILESIHTAFLISFINTCFINGFGNLVVLDRIPWDLLVSFEISFLISFIVNLFFVWRVWIFSEKIWAVGLLVSSSTYDQCMVGLDKSQLLLSTARYVIGTVALALGWESFKDHAYALLAVAMGVAILGDALLALILAYYLRDKRTPSSAHLVAQILAYVVGTGALTSMVIIMDLVSILASPNNLIFIPFGMVLARLYANSALLS
ncbi:hypothetical protein SCLCIDRAFT_457164 [Scleroderma citrinum Foug A]|uniref:DUF6534 domain-containing protein n=1 Tax=Scleroderma citrinum Foug A TaxID=1036808 RepID=A0A0C3DAQ9_9AGAM|nr:hypothetical protein SCLCIDRAFT_457164 [Scleroderma citrinum Foug A]